MAQTVTVETKTINAILARLDQIVKELKTIKTKMLEKDPTYGSEEWWKRSDKKALREIKEGKGIKFDTAAEAIKWLNS